MPRKKVEKPEIVEEKSEEIMDTTPDGQEEAVLSDPDKNPTEGTEGENSGEQDQGAQVPAKGKRHPCDVSDGERIHQPGDW